MDKDKIAEIVMISLGVIAALLVVASLFILAKHDVDTRPCEQFTNHGSGYVPVPKRCEKGEK